MNDACCTITRLFDWICGHVFYHYYFNGRHRCWWNNTRIIHTRMQTTCSVYPSVRQPFRSHCTYSHRIDTGPVFVQLCLKKSTLHISGGQCTGSDQSVFSAIRVNNNVDHRRPAAVQTKHYTHHRLSVVSVLFIHDEFA